VSPRRAGSASKPLRRPGSGTAERALLQRRRRRRERDETGRALVAAAIRASTRAPDGGDIE
jgi:hypothetical protein